MSPIGLVGSVSYTTRPGTTTLLKRKNIMLRSPIGELLKARLLLRAGEGRAEEVSGTVAAMPGDAGRDLNFSSFFQAAPV